MAKKVTKKEQNGADNELREFLLHSFTKIDQKFDNVGQQFREVNKKLAKIENEKADKADIERVLNRITMTNNKIDDFRADQIGMQRQIERQKEINIRIAQKLALICLITNQNKLIAIPTR